MRPKLRRDWLCGCVLAGLCLLGLVSPTRLRAQTAVTVSSGGPYSGAAGYPITFLGTATPPPGALIVSYQWSFGDGTGGSGPTTQHTYAQAGVYAVALTVVDSNGLSATSGTTAAVGGQPAACQGVPLTGATTAPACIGTSPCSNASLGLVTANCVSISSCTTIVGNGTPSFVTCGAAAPPIHVDAGGPYAGAAEEPITFRGSGSVAAMATCPQAPVTINGTLICPSTGATVPAMPVPVSYRWSFGDGQLGVGASVQHAYARAGSYVAALTVSFSDGSSGSGQANVTITPQLPPRTLALTSGCNNVALTFADGTPLTNVASAVSGGTVLGIWELGPLGNWLGWFAGANEPSDLTSVRRLDAAFICVQGNATLSEPGF